MISKLSWVLFIPLTAAAVFLKLAQTIMDDGAIFGLSDMMLDYTVIGCAALVFLFTLIMCLCDRKISRYYLPHRNFAAGLFGIVLALLFAADGANKINRFLGADKLDPLAIAEAALLVLSAVVFVVLGLTHSFLGKDNQKLALFNVMPALLCAIRLVSCFVEFTTISIMAADVTRLVCYIFATMFFFNYAVALSLVEAKHSVKSCMIFGFPAVVALLSYSVAKVYTEFNTTNLIENAQMLEIGVMGLYILSFLVELTIFIKDRDHVIIEDQDDVGYKDLHEDDVKSTNDYVVVGVDDEDRSEQPASSYLTVADTDDFLYQVTPDSQAESSYLSASAHEVSDYITNEIDSEYNKKEFNLKSYSDTLDEIDKLILEISGDD